MKKEEKEKIKKECLTLLKKAGCNERIVRHCIVVANVALKIARQKRIGSKEIILRGALLHDIGRAKTSEINHGFIGGEIAKKLGVKDEKIIRIIQRHVGAGLTADEAKKFGLPEVDFIPETIEEKIVAYADKLVDNDKVVSFEETLEKMKEKLGKNHPAIKRMKKLQKDVMAIREKRKRRRS